MFSKKALVTSVLLSVCASGLAAQHHSNQPSSHTHVIAPNETVKVYRNGKLVEKLHNPSNKALVIHLKPTHGKQPAQETIQIQSKGPHSQSHELIEFSNGNNLKNTEVFNHVMQDQRHEQLMMQQYLHHMNHYMNAEIDQINRDEQGIFQNMMNVEPTLPLEYRSRLAEQQVQQPVPVKDQSWWGLIKSYF